MYQHLVEKLIYLYHKRLNIAYSVGSMSLFMQDSKEVPLQVAHTILEYLKEVQEEDSFKKN